MEIKQEELTPGCKYYGDVIYVIDNNLSEGKE